MKSPVLYCLLNLEMSPKSISCISCKVFWNQKKKKESDFNVNNGTMTHVTSARFSDDT